MEYWQDLKEGFENKKLLLLGEKHGASVNTEIISSFVSRLGINTIAIEIDPKWQNVINKLRTHKAESVLRLIATERWMLDSRVISLKHFNLFKKFLNNKKIVSLPLGCNIKIGI